MSPKSCIVITIFVMLFSMLSLSPAEAVAGAGAVQKPKFNITEILGRNPSFSTFVSLLNQTGLAKEINARDTITVLAVEDGAIGGLSSKPLARIKDILSTHVILDFYDFSKLQELSSRKNTTVTTMYQATGVASNQQGFLKIVVLTDEGPQVADKIRIGSAVKGAPIDIKLVDNKEFDYKKYDYVVLTVSGVIFTPGIDGMTPPTTVAPPMKSPVPHNKTTTPAPSPDDEDDDEDDTPTPEAAPTPAEAPTVSSPSDAPTADADDVPATAPPPPKKSSAMHISSTYNIVTALIVVLASAFASAGL